MKLLPRTLLAALCLITHNASAATIGDTILILDASNSMWGQIDGRAKIEIAREAVGGILAQWDANRPLGLMAYGHRRPGDCGDIELIAPVDSAAANTLTAQVNALVPRGKPQLIAVEIAPPPASLKGPDQVAAGTDFQVSWEGPNRPKDYVTVVQKGAEEGSYNRLRLYQ